MTKKRIVHSYEPGTLTTTNYMFCGLQWEEASTVNGDCTASLRDLFGDGNRPLREETERFCEKCFEHEVFQQHYAVWLLAEAGEP